MTHCRHRAISKTPVETRLSWQSAPCTAFTGAHGFTQLLCRPHHSCRSPPTTYFWAHRFSSAPILTFPDSPLRLNTNPFPFTIPIENRYPFPEAAQFNQFYPQGLWQGFAFSHPLFGTLRIKLYSLDRMNA